jgi:alanine racemase
MAAHASGVECAAVVKADAYGLGAARVAGALAAAGCRRFFVATVEEATALRRALAAAAPNAVIYVFEGPIDGAESIFDSERLVPVLYSLETIDTWGRHARASGGRRAVLDIDTGMGRLGLEPRDVDDLAASPERLKGLSIDYMMSHLACADEPTHPMNADQRRTFDRARAKLAPAKASLANSAGVFLGADYRYDLIRAGASLYGISPPRAAANQLRPVVRLQGRVLQVRVVDSDRTVGYGAAGRARKGGRLATVAVGYADGYPRALSHRGSAFFGDVRIPVVGRISMDFAVFDVTGVPEDRLRPGSHVDLIGPHHSVDQLAEEAGTIGYELLTRLGRRFRRVYIGG